MIIKQKILEDNVTATEFIRETYRQWKGYKREFTVKKIDGKFLIKIYIGGKYE